MFPTDLIEVHASSCKVSIYFSSFLFFLSLAIVLLFVLYTQCKCNTKHYVGSAGKEMHESIVSEEEQAAMPGPSRTGATVTDG